ncbi:alpha-2-macroglobulin [Tenacibaculum sp. E3R01]|nr:alpha-2-macroglobulin [Tenacibaculum sp. E3R01]
MIFLFSTTIKAQQNYQSLWDKVHKFEIDNLPKSASKIVDEIYEKAKKNNNSPQLVKTLFYKSKFSLILEEDAQLKIIDQFKEHIVTTDFPTKNVLENILANLYWQFFNQNRWKFYNRTQTQNKVDSTDFRTWDLNTLFNEIHKYYKASLADKNQLQKINIQSFSDILRTTKDTKKYHPTLFDFLAQNSLDFYKTTETNITKPSYQFKLNNPNLLSDFNSFISINLTTKDTTSLQFNALKIYQDLLQFHAQNKNLEALVTTDLQRLTFVKQHGIFKNKEKLYLQALEASKNRYKTDEISGLYSFEIAKVYTELANTYQPNKVENKHRFKNKEALDICNKIILQFPESDGAKKCEGLKQQILTKSLSIITEKNIPINHFSKVLVTYKNSAELYFSIYKITAAQILELEKIYNEKKQIEFIKKLDKTTSWYSELKDEQDYQQHSTEVSIPKLSGGNHLILATTKKELSNKTTVAFSFVQATNIAFINNNEQSNNYQVVNRNTGKPIVNAKVHFTNTTRNHYDKKLDNHFVTNENGEFTFIPNKQYYPNVNANITYKDENVNFGKFYINPRYKNNNSTSRVHTETFLFTDRSIYRPGQTVHFKGIAMETFKKKATVKINETVAITLKDVNHQVLKEIELQTNEFGSFSSKFVLPNQGLTGQFLIETSIGRYKNYTYFSVEEYKRPKFETVFKPISSTIKINDSVTVNGFAKAFSGVNITDAKVIYRVHRKVQYPRWWYWYRPYFTSQPQEITQGEGITDSSGNFSIQFKALPDESIAKKDLPIFIYEVSADVTDINGETRSATTEVKVGYHALVADIESPENLDKTKSSHLLKISTKNLNDEFVASTGTLKIYKLQAPNRILRKRPWTAPDYQTIPKKEFENKFPNDAYTNEDNSINWKKGTLVFNTKFNTENQKEIALNSIRNWESGKYVIILDTQDKFGQKVTAKEFVSVFSKLDKLPADTKLVQVTTNKASYNVGDKAEITISSNSKDITLMLFIEKQHKTVERKYIHLTKNHTKISIPVTKDDIGGFGVKWYFVNYNAFEKGNLLVSVPYPKTDLEISTKTFRDKLQPGQKQTWSFTIKGTKKDVVAAELLAGMYDASLDAFKPHKWNFSPIKKPIYSIYNNSEATISFGNNYFRVQNLNDNTNRYYNNYQRRNVQYNWFGFSFINDNWVNTQYLKRLTFQRTKFDGTISGVVIDENGEPFPLTNVIIKGTKFGTTTNFEGEFSIKANKDDIVVISFLGYKTIELKIKNYNDLLFTLLPDKNSLDEVVIAAGYTNGDVAPRRKMTRIAGGVPGVSANLAEVEESAALDDGWSPKNSTKKYKVGSQTKNTKTSLKGIQIRKNLQETAFFYPHLTTDKNGNISFNFTAPEALTKWKLQLLAHTKELHAATKTLETVTQKELMVTPNAPRFLRHGDKITLSSKISNLTSKKVTGIAQLILTNPVTGKEIDLLNNTTKTQSFSVDKKGNTTVSWNLTIPETIDAVQYKVVAKAGDFSDGEQNALPVLSNRMLVTETLPMWVRSNQSKTFTLDKLKNNTSTTLKNHKLTVEVTSNPAWYAVQALPYLMEYPHECSEQTFARYYANTLACHIVNSNPRIQEVFNQWKSSEALISNLEKNQELKSLIIQETPWLRDAQSETEQKKRIALLFDLNKLSNEEQSSINKLKNMQLPNGGFPWFKGSMYPNRYITQHIASGFGHLKKLGVTSFNKDVNTILHKAIKFLDLEIADDYKKLLREADKIKQKSGAEKAEKFLAKQHIGYFELQYLYMRSFYSDIPVIDKASQVIEYYRNQSATYWNEFNLYSKGLIALIQHRNGDKKIASKVLNSLKENSITSEELGMYWKTNKPSWYWYEAPIETQALLIEAFAEIENDTKTVDNLKIWLLKNKQVSQWKTTKATTEAVYALLLQGSDWISVTDLVDLKIGDKKIDPTKIPTVKVEAGTGYFKTSWNGNEITPNMGEVSISTKGKSIAWGGLYWQYFEDLDKITSAKTPLQLKKKLFKKVNSDTGKKLIEVTDNSLLKVGDLLTVRIELRSDRNMEFIHMKDMRASGVEPINVLSKYKWQDGLGYYESTKDASTNFFFDRLPKGVYVFEYDVRINNAGDFSNGITTIQNMYAPEFSSHSKGIRIRVE